jgi:hypothetical protein
MAVGSRSCWARTALAALALALSAPFAPAYVTMVNNGPSANRVDVVFLGDGYLASDLNTTYVNNINSMSSYLFSQAPFERYSHFFNIHRIDVVSNERGADVPPLGIYHDTALDASYYYDGVTDRLLYINEYKANAALATGLAGAGFLAEMKLVTVNDSRYGGGGGNYAVYAGGNSSATEIATHELGHSFAGLADEYQYNNGTIYSGPEPYQPDVTTDPTGAKWAAWLGYVDPDNPSMGSIGAYEGGMYADYGIYRPSQSSKMRTLGKPFDAVGREQIILNIYKYVRPMDSHAPNASQLVDPSGLWVDVDRSVRHRRGLERERHAGEPQCRRELLDSRFRLRGRHVHRDGPRLRPDGLGADGPQLAGTVGELDGAALPARRRQ